MTVRRNGILVDNGEPWTAAAYLRDDSSFSGTQHGILDRGTLCGLSADAITVVRNPFYGTREGDCGRCATRLNELAADC